MLRHVLPDTCRLLSFFLALPVCWSQIQTGRLTGTVYDPNKAVVPNAVVTVIETATNVTRQATTTAPARIFCQP